MLSIGGAHRGLRCGDRFEMWRALGGEVRELSIESVDARVDSRVRFVVLPDRFIGGHKVLAGLGVELVEPVRDLTSRPECGCRWDCDGEGSFGGECGLVGAVGGSVSGTGGPVVALTALLAAETLPAASVARTV